MLDFRMETFLSVCHEMNYTRAAEALNITQPAVSQHIKFLERHYGCRLFLMEGKKLYRTPQCEELLRAVTAMKHDEAFLKERIEGAVLQTPRLVFGVTLTIGEYAIVAPLVRYLKEHAEDSLQMIVANTSTLLSKLQDGTLNFAIVEGYFAKNEYEHQIYSQEHYIAVCAGTHVWEKKPERMEDLLSERLIVRESGSGTREILERALESRNLVTEDFAACVEVSSIDVIKELTASDCGITFLYEAAVKEELKKGTLQKIELTDFNLMHDFTFIWTKNSVFREYYLELIQSLK